MSSSKTFKSVTPAIWSCLKASSEKEHGTKYDPPNANDGTATTDSIVGKIVLQFNFKPDQQTIGYTILKKPMLVSDNQIWNGIESGIQACQNS